MSEIMSHLGYKDRKNFRLNYIKPLLDKGLLSMSFPDSPNHQEQKYFSLIMDTYLENHSKNEEENHPENIQENFQNVQKTSKKHPRNVQETSKKHPRNIQENVQKNIMQTIKENPFITRKKMETLLNYPHGVIKYHISQLTQRGIIKHEGSTKAGNWIILKNNNLPDIQKL